MGFASRLFNAVFARTLIRTDILSAAITAIAPAAFWLLERPMPNDLTVLISLWVAGITAGVLFARLVTSPYRIWKEDQAEIAALKVAIASPKRKERDRIAERLADDRVALADTITSIRRVMSDKRSTKEERKKAFHGAERYSDRFWHDPLFRSLWMDFYYAANALFQHRIIEDAEDSSGSGMAQRIRFNELHLKLDEQAGSLIRYILYDEQPASDEDSKGE